MPSKEAPAGDQPNLGPAVRTVLGDDGLVGIQELDHRPHGVSHLRTTASGRNIMVLCQGESGCHPITDLADRLIWLDGRAGAPEVIASGRSNELYESLVIRMSEQAIAASDPYLPIPPESLARLVGSSLKSVHSVKVSDCPFEAGISTWHAAAAAKVTAGEIEPTDSGPYSRLAPSHLLGVLDEMIDGGPAEDEAVLIHGMATTEHMWVAPDASMVFTGWQMCGVGNRHHDLAVAAASLTNRFGPALVPPMLESYGFDLVVPRQLDLHQLLAHLLGVVA